MTDHSGSSEKQWKEKFIQMLLSGESHKDSHFNVLTEEKYAQLLQEVTEAKIAEKKTQVQYRRLTRFDTLEVNGVEKLIARNESGEIKYYLKVNEIYDVIEAVHVAVGHGGRDKLKSETSRNYANITIEMINIFLSLCVVCQQKRKKKKESVSKLILHSHMNSRCQVDIIDLQTQADGNYKFIMVYQDHLTKFIILRALTSKRAEEVARQLNDIFLTFGAPCILQSDNDRDFVSSIIMELTTLWPKLKIIHGRACHNQSQVSVEKASQDIENMLASWMKDNNSTNWSEGLRYVQFKKNCAFHSDIKQSPYKAMFGTEPRVGISAVSLPPDIVRDIQDEDDLLNLLQSRVEIGDDDETNSKASKYSEHDRCRKENLEKQAKRLKICNKTHPPIQIGQNVTIPIPDGGRSSNDLWNIIGVVLAVNEDGMYQIGTKDGILDKLYSRSEFVLCTQVYLAQEQVPMDKQLPLRIATKDSVGKSQGFSHCSCSKKCTSNRCLCKRNSVSCNSKCHKSLSCNNKTSIEPKSPEEGDKFLWSTEVLNNIKEEDEMEAIPTHHIEKQIAAKDEIPFPFHLTSMKTESQDVVDEFKKKSTGYNTDFDTKDEIEFSMDLSKPFKTELQIPSLSHHQRPEL